MLKSSHRSLRIAVAVSIASFTAFALMPLPAFGDGDEGTVSAQVTVAAPCIELDTAVVNFQTLPFSTSESPWSGGSSPTIKARNCSQNTETILARSTDATDGGSVTWTLNAENVSACNLGVNTYHVVHNAEGENIYSFLGTENSTVEDELAAQTDDPFSLVLYMPCSGSDGAGATMSFQTVLTATF